MTTTSTVHVPLPRGAVAALSDRLDGRVVRASDDAYRAAVSMFNASIDNQPELVVQARSTADVSLAVRAAREYGMDLSVKGGGHGVAGQATAGRLVIDLSAMRDVVVEGSGVLHAAGGCQWVDVDVPALARGFAVPGGRVTHTGVGGLTLGGGQGWLSPKYGLTCDNLLSAEVVTADGEVLLAGPGGDEELLWALQGGGGNFGVVTRFDFRLHEIRPVILAGLVIHPGHLAADVLAMYNELVHSAGPDLGGAVILAAAPPAPFIPPAAVGAPIAITMLSWLGDAAEGERVLAPLRTFGPPVVDLVQLMPYTVLQTLTDEPNQPGFRNYWSAGYVADLTADVIQAGMDARADMVSPLSSLIFAQMGEAVNAVPEDATAFPHRDGKWLVHPIGMWADPAEDAAETAWVRNTMAKLRPFESGGTYLNTNSLQLEAEEVRQAFGAGTYTRLAAVKAMHDPDDVFRHATNIPPQRRG
jgi:FAD/FMN-containing dehydrogenase